MDDSSHTELFCSVIESAFVLLTALTVETLLTSMWKHVSQDSQNPNDGEFQ